MKYAAFLFSLLSVLVVAGAVNREKRQLEPFGQLMLCPPGGRAFTMAWTLACEMKKRRKRDDHDAKAGFSGAIAESSAVVDVGAEHGLEKRSPKGYRPATLSEIMKICCDVGCDIRDLLPYCGPF